jgi:periplasmic protein TonB
MSGKTYLADLSRRSGGAAGPDLSRDSGGAAKAEDTVRPRLGAAPSAFSQFGEYRRASLTARYLPPFDGVEIYSLKDIASAAGVPVGHVENRVIAGDVRSIDGWIAEPEAVRLVREIAAGSPAPSSHPAFFAVVKSRPNRSPKGLLTSAGLHALVVVLMVSSLTLLSAADDPIEDPPAATHLVYLMTPGPGGGGGGGGVKIPLPTRRAERKAPVVKKVSSPVPEVQPPPPPPEPKVEPPPPAPPPPVVQAPVVPKPADPVEEKGLPTPTPPAPATDQGSGKGGGAGTGAGQGVGEGRGSGIGDGSGGGEGGGPFRPGSGIEPPQLLREVKASYTDDARRRGIEGEVVLEIVVRRDGSVGEVHVIRGLESGLNQRAIEAVRQWRFSPAKRRGNAVDVIVEVSVDFKLR